MRFSDWFCFFLLWHSPQLRRSLNAYSLIPLACLSISKKGIYPFNLIFILIVFITFNFKIIFFFILKIKFNFDFGWFACFRSRCYFRAFDHIQTGISSDVLLLIFFKYFIIWWAILFKLWYKNKFSLQRILCIWTLRSWKYQSIKNFLHFYKIDV